MEDFLLMVPKVVLRNFFQESTGEVQSFTNTVLRIVTILG